MTKDEMTKDEMKDRISMALKDPILQQGFETICQNLTELEAQNKALQCCANCCYSYGGEEEPYHDCGYCHAMQCICELKLEEHTSDIYRMWEDKCDRWEMRVN